MRILYASERPPYPLFLGGAARCAHTLLRSMSSELGVACAAVGSSDYTVTPWTYPDESEFAALDITASTHDGPKGTIDCGYPIHLFSDFRRSLSRFVDEFAPDILWSQLEGARDVLELGSSKGIQGLIYVHDAEFDPDELRAIARLGSHVVCSSGFLARKAGKAIGREAHVVYPCPETKFGVSGDPHGLITMVNPHRVKGIETFFAIARRMPSERFLLLESWRLDSQALKDLESRLADAPNVRFVNRVSDMRPIYGQTKLLLVPSVWEEGFGMVAVEAQSCRIPVVASARGGLPESVGDGGILIDDYRNPDRWVEAVTRILRETATSDLWPRRAFAHASSRQFSSQELARRFLAACSSGAPRATSYGKVLSAARDRLEKIPALGRLLRRALR